MSHTRFMLAGFAIGVMPLLVGVAITFAGCDGDRAAGPPAPQDVARAYVAAAFRCGETGAGATYLSWSPERDWTRAKYIELEERGGCAPQPVPRLFPVLIGLGSDTATVWVYRADPQIAPGIPHLSLRLERLNGEWTVNSDDPESIT